MEIPRVILQTLSENGVGLDTGPNACRTAYLTNSSTGLESLYCVLDTHFPRSGESSEVPEVDDSIAAVRGTGRQIMSGYNVLFDTRRSKQMADADQHRLSNFDRWSGSLLEISL